MSRFGPRVLPVATPGFIENLANAFQQGYGTYERTRAQTRAERAEDAAETERDRLRARQTALDAAEGLLAPGMDVPRETPPVEYGPDYGPMLGEGLAGAMAETPPVAPTPQGVVPGAFDPRMRQFARPRLPVRDLPGGFRYDPNVRIDAELAQELGKLTERQRLEDEQRSGEMAARAAALQRLMGQPGYEGLTPEIVDAASREPELYRTMVTPYAIATARTRSQPTPRATPRETPVEQSIRQAVARMASQGIEEYDEMTGRMTRRPATQAELDAVATRIRQAMGQAPAPSARRVPAAPAGVDPTEWQQYLRETGQIP